MSSNYVLTLIVILLRRKGDGYIINNRKIVPRKKYCLEEEGIIQFSYADLRIFLPQRKVLLSENEICLTAKEFDVLSYLVKHPGWVFTKEQIYEAVWDDIPVSIDAKVECMIYSIRKKLRLYTDREYIHTVWGVGYKFDPGT